MVQDRILDYRQPEPGPPDLSRTSLVDPVETVKNLFKVFFVYPDTVVRKRNLYLAFSERFLKME